MHALIARVSYRWIDLFPQVAVTLNLKRIGYPARAPVLDIALLKDERCIPCHVLVPSILLSLLIHNDIEFINRLYLLAIHLEMHLDDVSSLFGYNIIQLASEIFRGEREVLGQYHMS